jgi:ketosteroid isomerase-like protein
MYRKKIRVTVLCWFALGLLCLKAGAQQTHGRAPGPGKEELRIRQVMADQVRAWNGGDVTAFMQGYWNNDSLTFITKTGPEYGWQMVLDHYKKGYPDRSAMGFLQFDHLILRRLSSDYYLIIGSWHIQKDAGGMGGQFTLLFRKIKGDWKIVLDHTS